MEVKKIANRDGTGPDGQGPLTGRKMGRCRGESSNEQDRIFERGRGRRDGRGFRR